MWNPFKKDPVVNQAEDDSEKELEVSSRMNYGNGSAVSRYVSGQYDNADRLHQIYCDFGYPQDLGFNEFWNMYARFGMAKTVVETIVKVCWVTQTDRDWETAEP